ncbi:MAG: NAD(P)-dependent oxidoreductase [Planctomycetota bacterium]
MSDAVDDGGAAGLPVMLKLAGRRCVVVGGGATAARRAAVLVGCGAEVVVVAPAMVAALDGLMIERVERGYAAGDLDGAFLVVAATDDPAVNTAVGADAAGAGALVNRADDAGRGDLTVMGHERRGPMTVAVDTGGVSAGAGKAVRAELMAGLDPGWAALLGEARRWRAKIRGLPLDAATRTDRLRRLTDAAARRVLAEQGEAALREHLRRVAAGEAADGADR